jgi:hypothetical protein
MEHFVVRVRTDVLIMGERAMALWVVHADSAEQALEIVRSQIASGCEAELTDHRLRAETIEKFGLAKGQAWHL